MPQYVEVNGQTIEFPDGMAGPDIESAIKKNMLSIKPQKAPGFLDKALQQVGNAGAGLVRGAGSIGATLLAPIDMANDAIDGKGLSLDSNRQRRADMDAALSTMGADTNSLAYKGGKLGGEIAGTAGAGGLMANGLSKIPALAQAAPSLINAVRTGGFGAGGLAARSAGGAINGAVTAGMVDPENMGPGALIGGALPGAAQIVGKAGEYASDALQSGAKKLMQSALKPTIAQLRTGDAQSAIDTLLKYGINPTKGGVEKMQGMVGDLNDQIAQKIADSGATVSKNTVMDSLNGVRQQFGRQVSPTADLGAIEGVAQDFAAHPSIAGDAIPVQLAQQMKQGTYSVLAKKYGQVGAADTEAQKALARGLKEQIAAVVPDVGVLNGQESQLINALKVSERRAMMDANKNPMGLALLAHDPVSWAAFMADKSALFKSLAARTAQSASGAMANTGGLLGTAMSQPMIRGGGLLALEQP